MLITAVLIVTVIGIAIIAIGNAESPDVPGFLLTGWLFAVNSGN